MRTFGSVPYGVDINQLGASEVPRFSINQPSPYMDGLVEDVIVNETHPLYATDGSNLGDILVRMIPDDRGVPKERLNWASPLEFSIQELPLKNETVLIFYSFGKLYYTRPISTAKKVTENSWPGLSARFSPTSVAANSDSAQLAAQGGPSYQPSAPEEAFTLGNEFKENADVKPVRLNEGDVIVQGRFGNIIRLGSSLFSNQTTSSPKANLLITVGQNPTPKQVSTTAATQYSLTYEDINKDLNSLWVVTDETVPFLASTTNTNSSQKAHLRSCTTPTAEYIGSQMFFSSNRIILNSKKSEISLFSNTQINLSSLNDITIDSETSVRMTANNMISISSPKIFIGSEDAKEPMVLGNKLVQFLDEFIKVFSNSTGVVISSTGPLPFSPTLLGQLRTLQSKLSTPNFISDDNFTTKTNTITVKNTAQSQLIQKQKLDATKAETPFTARKEQVNNTTKTNVLGRFNNR